MSVEEELDALFGVKLDELLEVRKQRAAALRKAGDREGAARIAATPKPTPAAWAVNQLWRADRPDFDRLLGVGEALRDALRGSLAGTGDARAMQALQRQQRTAIEPLLAAARARFEEVGAAATPAVIERLTTTLQAISTTGAWGDAAPGRLTKELGTPDLATIAAMLGPAGAQASGPHEMTQRGAGATAAATTDARSSEATTTAATAAREHAAPASLDEARAKRRREEVERAKRLEAAEQSLRDARAREEVATAAARVAQEALAGARASRRGLAERLAEAEAQADRSERDAEEARRRAEEARRSAEEARESAKALAERLEEGTRAEASDAERCERADAEALEATQAREVAERAVSDARRSPR